MKAKKRKTGQELEYENCLVILDTLTLAVWCSFHARKKRKGLAIVKFDSLQTSFLCVFPFWNI